MGRDARPFMSRRGLAWRVASTAVMASVGALSRGFLYGFNRVQVSGLDHLVAALDRRRTSRERGLLTVCNHVGMLDDPLIWGILPLRYAADPGGLRWGLGAHDMLQEPVCRRSAPPALACSALTPSPSLASTFFSLGQVLPTRRLWHSPLGGLYQPTMTQAIRLLSSPPATAAAPAMPPAPQELFFSTDGADCFPAPAADPANRHAWVHVFPEACCHQSPDGGLRYFKWGVSRLVLETDPAPEFIPMFIHGTQAIMPEDRPWPRWLLRPGNRVTIAIGQAVHVDRLFGRHRDAWKQLASRGDPQLLRHGPDAVRLRIDVAKSVRDEVQKLRQSIGLPRQDDAMALAETWSKEPHKSKFISPVDGSFVNRH